MNSAGSVCTQDEFVNVSWGARSLRVKVQRIERRVLRIDVQPSGAVLVFAPSGENLAQIEARVCRKRAWIFQEIDRVAGRPSVTPDRHFVSGETHLLLGRQYRLAIEQSDDPQVRVSGTRLRILARRVDDHAHCRRLLGAFYALTAREVFRERLGVVFPPFARKGLPRPSLIIRQMAKRWGSYTPKGRIVLNIDLIRASPDLIDYVICHELVHAFHPNHGTDWRKLFDAMMPDWEGRKARLEEMLR